MTGWKTKVAGVGAILTGLGLALAGLAADPVNSTQAIQGVLVVLGGLTALGLGHKVDKLRALFERLLK